AEDGIRDRNVTGVQTCALPISSASNRPFDAAHDGFVLGDGAAAMVLDSPAALARRGARPLAYLQGGASALDGHHQTRPSREGEEFVMREALRPRTWSRGISTWSARTRPERHWATRRKPPLSVRYSGPRPKGHGSTPPSHCWVTAW